MQRIKLVDIDLSQPLQPIEGLENFNALQVFLSLYGRPIGYIKPKINNGKCTVQSITRACLEKHTKTILCHLLTNGLRADADKDFSIDRLSIEHLLELSPSQEPPKTHRLTVAICLSTKQIDHLQPCLETLLKSSYSNLDILIVKYGPDDYENRPNYIDHYSNVRWIVQTQKNLGCARNRAILEAQGEVIAFIDVTSRVSEKWASFIIKGFRDNSSVMAVTGAVIPESLDTEAQQQFAQQQEFWQSPFDRQYYWINPGEAIPREFLNTLQFGPGINMAFRREVFEQIGFFNPDLESDELHLNGSDLELFFRVIGQGYGLTYEPDAIVRCSPYQTEPALLQGTLARSRGLFAYFLCSSLTSAQYRFDFLRVAFWFIRYYLAVWLRNGDLTKQLAKTHLRGFLTGPLTYFKVRRSGLKTQANRQQTLQPGNYLAEGNAITQSSYVAPSKLPNNVTKPVNKTELDLTRIAIRSVSLESLPDFIADVKDVSVTRILVKANNRVLGWVKVKNCYFDISAAQIQLALAEQLWETLLNLNHPQEYGSAWDFAQNLLKQKFAPEVEQKTIVKNHSKLDSEIPVSIVIATYDRPDDLRECLKGVTTQRSSRPIEIIVVDNHPASGKTPPIVSEFPSVQLIKETRQGSAYARNAGIVASRGAIVVTTDDDVIVPIDWLETLLEPFTDPSIMTVTGNILPLELETRAQQLFEEHCSLGCGFKSFELDGEWFQSSQEAVLGWEFGATANAAFRANVFGDPDVGLMEETLGPGTPAGAGEDPHMFYKVLNAGYRLRYHPDACVWHKHRRDMKTLSRQTYNYSKSCVAYHLTTLIQNRDYRSLRPLTGDLQVYYFKRLTAVIRGELDYPIILIWQEILGHIAGIWGYIRSHLKVKRQGRSCPYPGTFLISNG